MVWEPSEEEICAVLKLEGAERYSYFIKKIADQEQLWSLWQDGWALAADDNGQQLVPVWPHESYATLCARDKWAGYTPKVIELDAWLERWTPGIKRDGRMLAVFPSPSNRGVAVEVGKLADDLSEELTNY